MKYAFFPGCMIQVRYPQMEAAVRKTVPALGIELIDLDGLGCCPDPVFFKAARKLDWLALAARNLALRLAFAVTFGMTLEVLRDAALPPLAAVVALQLIAASGQPPLPATLCGFLPPRTGPRRRRTAPDR